MKTIPQLCRAQKRLKQRLEKYIENSKKTAIAKRNSGFYTARISGLNAMWEEFQQNDLAIDDAAAQEPADASNNYFEADIFGETEAKYFDYLGDLMDGQEKLHAMEREDKQQLMSSSTPSAGPTPATPESYYDIQLPRISLPKYNGDYDRWRSFHDIFVSLVHSNSKLRPVQKLHYLKECLVGEAEALLRHVPTTNVDYEPAWTKLKERYENKRILVNHQLKMFMSIPKLTSESAKGIKALINTTSECLQQLKSLDVDTSSWDAILIYLIVQRLPFTTLKLWEEEQGASQTLPSFAQFRTFLNTRLRILESISDVLVTKPTAPSSVASTRSIHTHHTRNQNSCPACHAQHFITTCKKYQNMNSAAKRKLIQSTGRCLNCLSSHHIASECSSKYRCRKCNSRHHTSLHADFNQETAGSSGSNKTHMQVGDNIPSQSPTITQPISVDGAEGTNSVKNFLAIKNQKALLSTALVVARTEHGRKETLRCLVDNGSEESFITSAACKRLGAKFINTAVTITGINKSAAATAYKQVKLTLQPRTSNRSTVTDDFLVIDKITDPLPTKPVQREEWEHLKDLKLADPTFWQPSNVDALLGAKIYARILRNGIRRGLKTNPIAVNTMFGWIIVGSTKATPTNQISAFTIQTNDINLNEQLKRFWEMEEVASKPILSKEDELCQQIYDNTHVRKQNGRYQVELPFVNNRMPALGESRSQALTRFTALERQFTKRPQLEEDYKKCLDEYITLGHMKAVNPPSKEEKQYYIPHHAVFKDSSTTKLRVVFDASAKTTNGRSLNEQLLTGPNIQPKLCATLLNWRKYKVAMNADIEKMYRMIEVHPKHQPFQHIIWRNPHTQLPQDYQLQTVTFDMACAPFLAIRTLQQLATDEKETWPLASQAVYHNLYVDDVLTGADTIKDAKVLQQDLIKMTSSAGFNLRKWASNEPSLLEDQPPEHRELKPTLTIDTDKSIKTLGIRWHPASDYFTFSVTPLREHTTTTKRNILSDIASLYDPLGWLSPVIISAKILMQTLWITGCVWDQQVSEQIETQWHTFKRELQTLELLRIPRWVHYLTGSNMQLHGFCDASSRAYAAVVYLRVEKDNGEITSTLLTSKTRVSPTKPTTIPRLELNGAAILSRLIRSIKEDMQLTNIPTFAWTDSTITLQWVKEHPSRWKTYVANRVVEIQEVIRYDQWQHISSKDNPADLASRGLSASALVNNKLWWRGPSWLTSKETQWPRHIAVIEQTELEARRPAVTTFLTHLEDNILLRYSSITRLTRIIAIIQRFKHNCRNPKNKRLNYLSATELQNAEITILRLVQLTSFPNEHSTMFKHGTVSRNSRLLKLTPFLDTNGLLRVGGRLDNAIISYNRKHPIIMPQDHPVTHLIIDKIHLDTLHGGTSLVLNTSRQKYWILDARRCITSRIHKCLTCAKLRGKTATQLMGNLPTPRITVSKPFTNIGIDYAGPITIKSSTIRNARLLKAYICIFVCLATRAIHIELVSDLSTTAFIAALKRFVSRRGLCRNIYSDCGTNFIGAQAVLDKELKQAIREATPEAAHFVASKGITWHFNPPAAPHFGGMWEAGVKSIKHHLRRAIGKSTCTFEEYNTVLTQIEACLNSRPLYCVRNDPENTFVLTPGHFLIGEAINAIPEPAEDNKHMSLSQRWQHVQQMVTSFWRIWTKDYLHQLQQRSKWQQEQPNMEVGDIVLLKSENMPPTRWPLGKIERVFPGPDGLIRVAEVKTRDNTFQRPIAKLCRLPIDRSRADTLTTP